MFVWNNATALRGPLITIISFVLIAGFLFTNLFSYQTSKQSLRAALIENELPLTSNNIYSEIQRDLIRPVFVASLMANDTFVKDWLLEGEASPERMVRYLDEIRKKYGVFTSFMVSEASRKYYHFSGVTQTVSENDPRDAWYFRVRDMTEMHELNVDINPEQDNALTIFINHKIFDHDGHYLAATGVGLKFTTLARVVDRYREHFGRHVYFVDESGKIMVRSDGAFVTADTVQSAKGMSAVADKLLAVEHGFFEYERDGETMLVSTRKIPELNWRVVVEQRESDALKSIQDSLITTLIVGFAVICVTLGIIIFAVNYFHNRLETMAMTDELTGIGNRTLFDFLLGQALKLRARDGKPLSVVLLDIDYFKRVNDTFGHLEGDRVIKATTDVVARTVRDSDVVCRWGGEELIILASNCGLDSALTLADKIRVAVESADLVNEPTIAPLTISAGVAEVQTDETIEGLLKRVDSALYQAKDDGRNCVRQA